MQLRKFGHTIEPPRIRRATITEELDNLLSRLADGRGKDWGGPLQCWGPSQDWGHFSTENYEVALAFRSFHPPLPRTTTSDRRSTAHARDVIRHRLRRWFDR
jgi:hypothetical protein